MTQAKTTSSIKECEKTRGSFEELRKDKNEIVRNLWEEDLSELKGKALIKLWKDREKEIIKRKEKKGERKKKI